ncbi:MAG: metal-dependent transcriptional regulator, partial [Candidatus Aureabacteria bacterium]|nr:metal-dependent transcriptional regulator [Candidatus Auribacterota bacterium]
MSPALEDYLESILIIKKEKEHVRVKDVAKFIDV